MHDSSRVGKKAQDRAQKKMGLKDVQEIKITASFDTNRSCISADGEGAGTVKLNTDATQLAPVLTAFAMFKGKAFEVVFRPLKGRIGKKLGKNGQSSKKVFR